METLTVRSSDTRELTKTEIEIAAAQITDRFVRYVKAVRAYWDWKIGSGDDQERGNARDADQMTVIRSARLKMEIPDGVALIGEECPFRESDAGPLKKWFKYWVAGSLTQDDMEDMYFYFSECDEIDFCWVFMDQPSFYYEWQTGEKPHGFDLDELVKEWFRIGTRAKKKQTGKSFAEEQNPGWYQTREQRLLAIAALGGVSPCA